MGSPIPHSLKVNVLIGWIRGISRDKIASDNNIDAWTVTNIIHHVKSNNLDIELMRSCFKNKKRTFGYKIFCSSG